MSHNIYSQGMYIYFLWQVLKICIYIILSHKWKRYFLASQKCENIYKVVHEAQILFDYCRDVFLHVKQHCQFVIKQV